MQVELVSVKVTHETKALINFLSSKTGKKQYFLIEEALKDYYKKEETK